MLKNRIVKSLYRELLWILLLQRNKTELVTPSYYWQPNPVEPNSDLKIDLETEENYSAQNSKAGMLRQLWRSETCLPRRVMPCSFCPWRGQPACSRGPLRSLHYAGALEWEGTCIDFKKQKGCSVRFKSMLFYLRVPHLISVLDMRWELWCVALLWVTPGLGAVGGVCCFTKGKWKMNGITQGILVYLQHFSSGWFDSN